ncbi:MAG: macro domain-containing protein [Candidatus Njordarchaeales archaeon]
MKSITIEVLRGDITEVDCDAIVNPANSLMIMGGGVAGAIKRKGGAEIEEEARSMAPVPIGEAIITKAGKLKSGYVIHSPTMERPAMKTTYEKVVKAVIAALRKADEAGLRSIAFPGMGTGVGGLSAKEGADALKEGILKFLEEKKSTSIEKIILVAFTPDLYEEFKRIKNEISQIYS